MSYVHMYFLKMPVKNHVNVTVSSDYPWPAVKKSYSKEGYYNVATNTVTLHIITVYSYFLSC